MRLVKPSAPAPGKGAGAGRVNRPNWLREWIENKGRYCLLACGCNADLNTRGALIICGDEEAFFCDTCNEWTEVVKPIRFNEYAGLPQPANPPEPLF